MNQLSFSDIEYQNRKRITKREEFLAIMEEIIPWQEWLDYINPYYPDGKRGRPPRGLETLLRMYLLQCWFNLSDEGIEDALYDSYALRSFMKINFNDEQVPDATTLLKFRHRLEEHGLTKVLFDAIKNGLEQAGCLMRGGTIVDATIIQAPSSTKNANKQRDPEMKSTKKGKQYHFGLKCHVGVDVATGYVHTLETTPANVHDVEVGAKLLRQDDEVVYGDSGYLGLDKRQEMQNHPKANSIDYRINQRPSKLKDLPAYTAQKHIEKRKSQIRNKVEHLFRWIKCQFGYTKTRYKGLYKNTQRLYMLLASTNLIMCAKANRTLGGTGASS